MRIGDLNSVRADLTSELDSLEAVKANVLGSHSEGQGLGGPDQEMQVNYTCLFCTHEKLEQ